MEKLAETDGKLSSSVFISGVKDPDEHPTFGGGFGDVYRASYAGKMVALKRIRTFTADFASHRTWRRLVNSTIKLPWMMLTC